MAKVTAIDWTVQTGTSWWSGTNTPIEIEIYRDAELIVRISLEPGNTSRLDSGENETYNWVFENPNGFGVLVSGTTVPYYVDFPNGITGHLKCKFIAMGEDRWDKDWISSRVYTGELQSVPGTIDSSEWVEDSQAFFFEADVTLSTDSSEGHPTWTLRY